MKLAVTHEEIAQMIGTSQETVSRLLADLKKRHIVQLKNSTLLIRNKVALKAMVITQSPTGSSSLRTIGFSPSSVMVWVLAHSGQSQ